MTLSAVLLIVLALVPRKGSLGSRRRRIFSPSITPAKREKTMDPIEDLFRRVALAISCGATLEDIHRVLSRHGLSEESIFLTYCAGVVLSDPDQPPHPSHPET